MSANVRLVSDRSRSPEQRAKWTETDLNWHTRQALADQGFRALHIREAHEPGVFDLLVYRKEAARVRIDGEIVLQEDLQIIRAWVELKVDKPTKPAVIEVSQKEFGRIHWTIGHNALFCTFDVPNDKLVFQQGDLKGRSIILPGDPYAIDWPWVFEKFKSRSK